MVGLDRLCRALVLIPVLVPFSCSLWAGSLGYRFPVNDRFELVSTTHIDAPILGAIDAQVTNKIQVLSRDTNGMLTQQDIASRSPGRPDYHLLLGCRISPVGQITDITGIDPNNATQALIAKNLAIGLPVLPDRPVQVGSTWGTERPFYLPKVSVPGVPEVLRIRSTYVVTGIAPRPKGESVTIDVTAVESPGQRTTVTARGTWLLDHETGKPISGTIDGEAVIRIVLRPTKCPFRLRIAGH